MNNDSRFTLKEDVRFRVVADEGVIVRQTDGEVLVVNELGGEILTLVQQGRNFGDIVSTLTESYDAEPQDIMRDTQAYLEELLDSQVVIIDA